MYNRVRLALYIAAELISQFDHLVNELTMTVVTLLHLGVGEMSGRFDIARLNRWKETRIRKLEEFVGPMSGVFRQCYLHSCVGQRFSPIFLAGSVFDFGLSESYNKF